jgi:spore coat protein SA
MSAGLPKVTFLTTGVLPVPAVDGGAVETLVETLLRDNEDNHHFDFCVISIWSKRAEEASRSYSHAKFDFLRPPAPVRGLDRAVFSVAKHVLKKRNVSAYRYVFERLWFLRATARVLSSKDCGTLVVENHPSIYLALKWRGNAARYAGRYFYHLHNEFPDLYGCLDIARRARAVLSISSFIRDSYDRLLGGFDGSREKVLMNCVDYCAYARRFPEKDVSDFRTRNQLGSDDFVFMYSGRITPEKGVRELLEAFSMALEKMPHARLMVVGAAFFGSDISSDYESEVHDIARQLGDKVVFTGYVAHEEMPLAYASSDVCCCPSVWDEPACLAVIEGMAAGKPVITTRSGGIPEYAGEGNAILLDRGDELSVRIADAMITLYGDEGLRLELASRGHKRAKEFDSSGYLNRFAECIGAGEAK